MNNRMHLLFLLSFLFFPFLTAHAAETGDRALRKQIGQMLIVGFRGTTVDEGSFIVRAMRDLNVGGVILFDIDVPGGNAFPRNIVDADQVRKLTAALKKYSPGPLMIAVDAEGGAVNRFKAKYGFPAIPSHQELGAKGDANETRAVSRSLGRELSDLGINTNFAPVIDVNVNPANPIIGKLGRSFSADPQVVAEQAAAFIEGQHDSGILTAVKHFPGHGSSTGDTHLGLVDITDTYTEKELIPYEILLKRGLVDMVMTSHIMNGKYDPDYPVTLSGAYIGPILRNRLGYDGVVVSDDMQMGAITTRYSYEDALVRAVNAGCDMLIVSNNGSAYDENAPYKAMDVLYRAVQEKKIPRERIEEASRRIEAMKKRFGQ
jgi:beta-N-acetylhexosaminidase